MFTFQSTGLLSWVRRGCVFALLLTLVLAKRTINRTVNVVETPNRVSQYSGVQYVPQYSSSEYIPNYNAEAYIPEILDRLAKLEQSLRRVNDLATAIKRLDRRLEDVEQKMSSSSVVAFSVRGASPDASWQSPDVHLTGELLDFPGRYVNEGGRHYHGKFGPWFVCPAEGVYAFVASFKTYSANTLLEAEVRVNKEEKVKLQLRDESSSSVGDNVYATQAFLTRLKRGDVVDVLGKHGVVRGEETVFTGFKLNTDVAFSSTAPSIPSEDITEEKRNIVKFQKLLLNIGGAYDSYSGIFTSPQTGNYVFFVSAKTYNANMALQCSVLVNTERKLWLAVHDFSDSTGDDAYAVVAAILSLRSGDTVEVLQESGLLSTEATFSGYFLHPTSSRCCELTHKQTTAFSVRRPNTSGWPHFIPAGGINAPITFRETLVNAGGHFDATRGVFSVPEKGYYVFFVTIVTFDARAEVVCYLRVNMDKKLKLQVKDNSVDVSDSQMSASQTVIFDLKPQDTVDLVFVKGGKIAVDTMFSGHYISNDQ